MGGTAATIGKYKVGMAIAIVAAFVYLYRYRHSESERGATELEQQVAAIELEKKKIEIEKQRLQYQTYINQQQEKLLLQYSGDESQAIHDLREREKSLKQQQLAFFAAIPSATTANNLPSVAGKWIDSHSKGNYYLIEQQGNQIMITEHSSILGESFVSATGVGYVDLSGNITISYQTLFGTSGEAVLHVKNNILQGIFQDNQNDIKVSIVARRR
ncbi:MAG: hypothetical protein RMJ87_01520 [Cytophagales bacterium]|nr:hypothetical protein [Bernardetiaceae bacterium]MDW8203681.1 hypothetical protein [Cytophagales bacterium]